MKTAAGISGIAAFLLAIALMNLGENRRSIRQLQDRFNQTEAAIAQLRAETAAGISRALALAAAQEPRDAAALQRDNLGASVQVNVDGSVGGGTLLFSRETHTYVVTACHVIQK